MHYLQTESCHYPLNERGRQGGKERVIMRKKGEGYHEGRGEGYHERGGKKGEGYHEGVGKKGEVTV